MECYAVIAHPWLELACKSWSLVCYIAVSGLHYHCRVCQPGMGEEALSETRGDGEGSVLSGVQFPNVLLAFLCLIVPPPTDCDLWPVPSAVTGVISLSASHCSNATQRRVHSTKAVASIIRIYRMARQCIDTDADCWDDGTVQYSSGDQSVVKVHRVDSINKDIAIEQHSRFPLIKRRLRDIPYHSLNPPTKAWSLFLLDWLLWIITFCK